MPTYISLVNLTDKGVREIKNAPERLQNAVKGIEEAGGKLIGIYLTMGAYDYVVIVESPSDEVTMTYLLGLGSQGNVRTTTMKAFSQQKLVALVKGVP
jgi:uncharacterized protein with GYD domain